MKVIKSTRVVPGPPNPGDIWTYKIERLDREDHNVYMRLTDAAGEAVYYRNSTGGDMYSVELNTGDIVKTKMDDPKIEVYRHAELRL